MMFEEHDYKNFPELTNAQLEEYGFTSPHQQITEDFTAEVVKVHDGDTVTLRTSFRDFDFPLRFINIDAPEMNTEDGKPSQEFMKDLVEGKEVTILIHKKNRVEKYGRLLGNLIIDGIDAGEISMVYGHSWPFSRRREGELPNLDKYFAVKQWFP